MVLINFDLLCSAVTLSSIEETDLQERSDPYQICVVLSASPSGGDLTVSFSSTGSANCKNDVKQQVDYLDLLFIPQLQRIFSYPLTC